MAGRLGECAKCESDEDECRTAAREVYRKSSSLRAGDGRSAVGVRHEKELFPQGMHLSINAEILLRDE